VGPELAEMLHIPFVAYASQIEEIKDGYLRVRRMVEEGHEVIETTLPAIITVAKEINVPRLPSLRGIMKSKSVKITTWGIQELGVAEGTVGLAGSSTQVIKVFFPQRVHQAEMLAGTLEKQVDTLIDRLKSAGLC
jgi:electron transfer flavoprotein beta subunit